MFASLRLKDFIAITFYQHCVILVGPVVFIYGLPNWTRRIYTYQIPTFTWNPVDRHTPKTIMNILLLHITLSFRAFFSFLVLTTCLGGSHGTDSTPNNTKPRHDDYELRGMEFLRGDS